MLLAKILFNFTSEEIIFIVSILAYLEKDIIPKDNLRLKSTGFILRFFPLVIHSAILRTDFLDPCINLMSKLLANWSNFISILSSSITFFIY